MQTASRLSLQRALLILVGVLVLALALPALAGGRGRGAPHKEGRSAHTVDEARPERAVEDDSAGRPDHPAAARRNNDGRHGCRRGERPAAGLRCDYYYDDDEYYDEDDTAPSSRRSAPRREATPAPKSGSAAKSAPAKLEKTGGAVESFTPHADQQLRAELKAAHQNWKAKKRAFDEASQTLADAEYKAYKDGSQVDPALAERRAQARSELSEAKAEIDPLVEKARAAGIAPGVVKLYEQAHSGD